MTIDLSNPAEPGFLRRVIAYQKAVAQGRKVTLIADEQVIEMINRPLATWIQQRAG